MKFPFLLLLFTAAEFVAIAFANLAQQRKLCSNRCHRLLKRSLERIEQAGTVEEILYRTIAYSRQQLLASLEEQHNTDASSSSTNFEHFLPEPFQNICWKFFDFEDCSRQCEKAFFRRRKRKNDKKTVAEEEKRMVLQFCHRNNLSVPRAHFSCIHKFHAFVEIRCSSYQQKAVQLRLMALQIKRQMPVNKSPKAAAGEDHQHLQNAIDQKVCLLLHQHSTCLGNALGRHCPSARSLFTARHALRDNFLSFVLPFGTAMERTKEGRGANEAAQSGATIELDQLFSDEMLDMCQLLDFNRMMAQWQQQQKDGMSMNSFEDEQQGRNSIRRGTTKRAVGTIPPTTTERAVPSAGTLPGRRRVFSSDEDLLDTPPNFQYSSARLPPDFYTRYAICRAQPAAVAHSTFVQLLPKMTPTPPNHAYDNSNHHPKWPHTATKTAATTTEAPVSATRATWPDEMLTTQMPSTPAETLLLDGPLEVYTSVSLPYLINGHVTVPHRQWDTPAERTTVGSKRTGTAPAALTTLTPTTIRSSDTPQFSDEFKIHKLPNDADVRNGGEMTTNWPRYGTRETEQLPHLQVNANNMYFAKILQFDEEEDNNNNNNNGQEVAAATGGGRSTGTEKAQGGRVTAFMEPFPRQEYAKHDEQQRHMEKEDHYSAEDDYFDEDDDDDDLKSVEDYRSAESEEYFPYKISTTSLGGSAGWPHSTPSSAPGRGRLADLSAKSRVPVGNDRGRSQHASINGGGLRRIVVTAEPVPGAHSDVLLVLLGLYGTFFGVAAFLLLCLLLACLERRRRRHGLLGRYRRKYCLKKTSAKKSGSAVLYLDERLGTVKTVGSK